jgi:hypothetical protein
MKQRYHKPTQTLGQKQRAFAWAFIQLQVYALKQGYEITYGDLFRDYRVHGAYGEKASYSAASSLHKKKLAGDLNLFKEDDTGKAQFLRKTSDHAQLGAYWIKLGEANGLPLKWGGDKGRSDGNHYSLGLGDRW